MSAEASARSGLPARLELGAILVGGVIGLVALSLVFGDRKTDFENLALGDETVAYYARHGDHQVHCIAHFDDVQECIRDARARSAPGGHVLWLGNSQLHGINQMREGEETASAIAHERLEERGIDVVAVSRGNTNPEEHLVWFAYLQTKLQLRALVLPVVFMSLRRTGVFATTMPAAEDPEAAALLGKSEIGREILEEGLAWGDTREVETEDETIQGRTETALVSWLEEHSRLWDLRFEARGNLFRYVRVLRNTLLGIEPGTVRRVLPGSYDRNMGAIEAMLDLARDAGIPVLVYVAPLRQDVDPPHVQSQYDGFKRELTEMAERYGARIEDYDLLVPAQYWGSTVPTRFGEGPPEVDFLHFQYPGHVLLADRVSEVLQTDAFRSRE